MPLRERRHESAGQQNQSPAPGDAPGDGLDSLRQAGEDLYRAADDAIRHALAGDSLQFLQATKQQGGQ